MEISGPENVINLSHDFERSKVESGLATLNHTISYLNIKIKSPIRQITTAYMVYNPLGYLPQGVGMFIASCFNLSVLQMFYIGRFFNLLAGVSLIFLAIKYAPFGKMIFLFTGLLPMTIHQLASSSNDSLSISGLLFFTSQILYFRLINKLTPKRLIYLLLLSLIFIQIKPGYIAFLLLFLTLSPKQFKSIKEFVIFMLIVLGANLLEFALLSNLVNYDSYVKLMNRNDPYRQVSFIINHPWDYIIMFINSLLVFKFWLLRYLLGTFGWATIALPDFLYIFIFIVLIFIMAINNGKISLSFYQRSSFFIIFFTTFVIIMTLQFIVWTEPSSTIIQVYQGRYFIGALPLLIFSFYQINCNTICKIIGLIALIIFLAFFMHIKLHIIYILPFSLLLYYILFYDIRLSKLYKGLLFSIIYIFIASVSCTTIYNYYSSYYNLR
jgi:uncharacterized membrane protein